MSSMWKCPPGIVGRVVVRTWYVVAWLLLWPSATAGCVSPVALKVMVGCSGSGSMSTPWPCAVCMLSRPMSSRTGEPETTHTTCVVLHSPTLTDTSACLLVCCAVDGCSSDPIPWNVSGVSTWTIFAPIARSHFSSANEVPLPVSYTTPTALSAARRCCRVARTVISRDSGVEVVVVGSTVSTCVGCPEWSCMKSMYLR